MTGVDMSEQEKLNYYKKLQQNYRSTPNLNDFKTPT
jgi:hypothetical protein